MVTASWIERYPKYSQSTLVPKTQRCPLTLISDNNLLEQIWRRAKLTVRQFKFKLYSGTITNSATKTSSEKTIYSKSRWSGQTRSQQLGAKRWWCKRPTYRPHPQERSSRGIKVNREWASAKNEIEPRKCSEYNYWPACSKHGIGPKSKCNSKEWECWRGSKDW